MVWKRGIVEAVIMELHGKEHIVPNLKSGGIEPQSTREKEVERVNIKKVPHLVHLIEEMNSN